MTGGVPAGARAIKTAILRLVGPQGEGMVREQAWPATLRCTVGASARALNERFRARTHNLLSTHWSTRLAINIVTLREKLARNFRTETLDDFRSHLDISLRRDLAALQREYAAVGADPDQEPDFVEEYRSHLESLMDSTREVLQLGNELAIVALYRRVETHLNKVLRMTFPASAGLASRSDQLKAKHPFITTLPNLAAFDELRLLNNDVKHNDGVVSKKLATPFPGSGWVEGAPLEGLDTHLQRLQPKVELFVQEFVTRCFAELRASAAPASAATTSP